MRKRFSVVAMVVIAMMLVVPGVLASTTTATVVSPGNMQGWFFQDDGIYTGQGSMVIGPGAPPLGTGSAQIEVDGNGRYLLSTFAHAGTRFEDIVELQYSTYRSQGEGVIAVSLQFDVDYDLSDGITTWMGRLVFEPYHSFTVVPDEWQTWSPMSGLWWATGAPGNGSCPQSSPCTWDEIRVEFPNAGIRADIGMIHFKAGGPWSSGFVGNVDAFTISDTSMVITYDFELEEPIVEPPVIGPPASKDECKQGGWQEFNNPTFKNQGECVSSVASDGKAGGKK